MPPPCQPFFVLAAHFLRLAENAAELLIVQGNRLSVVSTAPLTPKMVARRTRWSDHAVGIAVLFNFFHGIELVLKGVLSQADRPPNSHQLTQLLNLARPMLSSGKLQQSLDRYISSIDTATPLGLFLTTNAITIDDWYQALKYPSSNTGRQYLHTPLQFHGSRGVTYWRTLRRDARTIRIETVALYNQAIGSQHTNESQYRATQP